MSTASRQLLAPLRLHPLTFLEEGSEDVTIGRADIDSYGLFPPDGAALLRQLESGMPPAAAAEWYRDQYGESVDIEEFLDVLDELDLVVQEGEEVARAGPVKWQRLGRALFSPVAAVGYAAVVSAAVLEMIHHSALVPAYQHLFFTRSSLTILTLGIVLGQVPWMLLHEASHALAGRRLGLNSKLGIGRRFYYLVFTTALDGLVAVPRRKRYLPMLAGILLDVLVVAVLILAADALAGTGGFGALMYKLSLCMAFGVVLRLAWQFYFFLRTDLYFLATTVLGCNDLQTVSRQLLANRVNRLLGRRRHLVDETTWTARDRTVARWYSWLMVGGYAFLTALIFTAMIPAAVRVTEIAAHRLTQDLSVLSGLDFAAFLTLNFGEFLVAGYLALRAYRRNRAQTAARRPAAQPALTPVPPSATASAS